jgi:flagellar protein FliO/FliZ
VKFLTILILMVFSFSAWSAKNELVDVSKDSKLSDYFKKINPKVTDNAEEKPLVSVKKMKSEAEPSEENILLKEARTPAEASGEMSPFQKMMFAIIALLAVAGGLMIMVQKMGRKKGYSSIAQNIKILTQKSLGPKKSLMLVRVAGETILLGVTDQNINHIKTLSLMEDEIPQFTEPQFSSQLQEKIEQTQAEPTRLQAQPEEVDGYAISSLSDVKDTISTRFSV